jgi:hypothetical protein
VQLDVNQLGEALRIQNNAQNAKESGFQFQAKVDGAQGLLIPLVE